MKDFDFVIFYFLFCLKTKTQDRVFFLSLAEVTFENCGDWTEGLCCFHYWEWEWSFSCISLLVWSPGQARDIYCHYQADRETTGCKILPGWEYFNVCGNYNCGDWWDYKSDWSTPIPFEELLTPAATLSCVFMA